ncbi:MAG: DUF1287 domain-containing protein [Bacteroidetes bacterium]|nr:DUF1287 domain-containing protein [Bacteroidota bacterium]
MKNLKHILIICFLLVLVFETKSQTEFQIHLSDSTLTLTKQKVTYDPSYFRLNYPNGDVPSNKGVCTDVVIRAYRKVGIDLQQLVHEDMQKNFEKYPKNWGLKKPDKNIDHRRVPNLMTYFSRFGKVLSSSQNGNDYKPGEIVCWNLGGGITHIGIIVNKKSTDNKRYLVVHNIGSGQVLADCLFNFKIIGHYEFEKQ